MMWSNLLDDYTNEYTIVNRTLVPDGIGGTKYEWTDGAVIQMAEGFDNSLEMKVAQKQGVTSTYSFLAKSNVILPYHTVLRRNKDGVTLRITTQSQDNHTPQRSPLNARYYEAELFVIPKEGE